MADIFSNKKKIRGWNRKIRQIEQWKKRHIALDMEELCRNNRDYVKLWIDPFYRINRRHPPIWFSRLLFEAMLEVYKAWYEQMKELNEPFYLKIWLYHPNFINSQIVVAFRNCLNFYDYTFDKSSDHKVFPSHLYSKAPVLQDFRWELAIDSDHFCLSDLQEEISLGFRTDQNIAAIERKAYKCETVKLGTGEDTVYSVRVGDV